MPHFPKPWFRPSRKRWYVEIDGKQHSLGPDKKQAFERYHDLMRNRPQHADVSLALGVIDAYLEWTKQNKSERTYEWYHRHCQNFAKTIPTLLSVGQLKKHHLTACLEKHPDWSSTTKNGLCRAVCRAFKWAEDEELILKSPLTGFKKPKPQRREVIITETDFHFMLGCLRSEVTNDLFTVAWETGARPQEITAVEKRHVDLQHARWIFPPSESKGGDSPRIVYLNPVAMEITHKLCVKHPDGPLFRNANGKAWNRFSLNCVFGRIQIALGMERAKELGITVEPVKRFNKSHYANANELALARANQERRLADRRKSVHKLARRHGTKYTLYHFRHSWATRALQKGIDPLTVAILMGHRDPSMLARVYQHLAHDPDFLRSAVDRTSGTGIGRGLPKTDI